MSTTEKDHEVCYVSPHLILQSHVPTKSAGELYGASEAQTTNGSYLQLANVAFDACHVHHVFILFTQDTVLSDVTVESIAAYDWQKIGDQISQFLELKSLFLGFSSLQDITLFLQKAKLPAKLYHRSPYIFAYEIKLDVVDEASPWVRHWQEVDSTTLHHIGKLRW